MERDKKIPRFLSFSLIGLATAGIIFSIIMLCVGYVQSMRNAHRTPLLDTNAERRVLFISSYSENLDTVNAQLTGIFGVFEKNNVICDTEFMDMKIYDSPENATLFYETLRYKIDHFKLEHEETYDAVLLGDAAALAFALEHQDDLFPETPMVFFGLNDPETVRLAAQNPFVTGSVNQSDFSQTIELATKLNKTATNITAVYDDSTEHGRSEGQRFFALKNRYPEFTFSALKTSDYTRTELGKQLAQFTDDTILICLSAYFDKEGFYHSIPETAHFFYTHAKIPVYTKLFGSVGKGFLGGYLFDFIEAGRYSAQVILDVLDGKSMSDYPLKKDLPSHFYFDDEQMKHFRLNAHLLPKGTILVNEKPSFWHQFHVVLIPFITIVASLMLLLILIFHYARQLRRVHDIDALTKLPNRHVVQAAVRNLLKAKCDFAIIMIDVDELKLMNAFYTFACGDYILCEMARRLKSIDRLSEYMIARYANDDFAIVLKDTRLRKNDSLLYLIKQIISEPFEFSENQIFIKTNIGIANYTGKDDITVDECFSNADSAMCEAKLQGKNKTVFFTKEMLKERQTKQEIAKILEKACNSDDGFYVLYQPQVDITTGEIHGYEALVRLKTVKIYPSQFIPIAEESGLMAKIGRIVTEQVIKQMVEWRKNGFPLRKVSINYSAAQMADKEYINYLKTLMEKNDISPDLIQIEITESLFMGNKKIAQDLAADFNAIGIQLALDDFGTGYSSLAYLTYIPVKTIKLDKSLIDACLQEDKESFIKHIINLVHSLNMKLIVEGVEYKWQYEILKKLKNDVIQGYYFSKPISAKDVEVFTPPLYELRPSEKRRQLPQDYLDPEDEPITVSAKTTEAVSGHF